MHHPIQPLVNDAKSVLRFKQNAIVRHLLDWATPRGMSMNDLEVLDFSNEDRQQFAQLIGLSLSGYSELPYVTDEAYAAAEARSQMPDGEEMDQHAVRNQALRDELQRVRTGIKAAVETLQNIGDRSDY